MQAHRVWIELERPATEEQGHARAKLLSNMLRRLGDDSKDDPIWWSEKQHRYCYNKFGSGGYVVLDDGGEWFNLDFFGREADANEP